MRNVEVRKNKEGYELNLNTLIYSELLMSNVRFLVTNQICRGKRIRDAALSIIIHSFTFAP